MNRAEQGFRGLLIKESLDDETVLERMRVTNSTEVDQPQPSSDQPGRWTLIAFEGSEIDADPLAELLSQALKPRGWYVDFSTSRHKFVILPGKVFKYEPGDRQGEADAKAFARSVGVPERQLEWPEP